MQQTGAAELPYFSSSVNYQRGRGFGNLLRGIFRAIKPIFKKKIVRKGLKKLGRAAAQAGIEASQKALEEDNVRAFAPALKAASAKQIKKILTGGVVSKRRARAVSRPRIANKRRRVVSDIFT